VPCFSGAACCDEPTGQEIKSAGPSYLRASGTPFLRQGKPALRNPVIWRGMQRGRAYLLVGGRKCRACGFQAPVLNDGSELDRLYHQNAERILLQSVAASTMSAHLAAAALGYAVWWITAIGQDDIQRQIKPMLAVPEELSIIDVMCFGPPAKPSYKRWKKPLDQIMSWDRFNPECATTVAQIDEWIKSMRHKVMYRDESKFD